MSIEWRTVQLFLDENGVHEVQLDLDNSNRAKCTCQSFKTIAKCKHVSFVKKKVKDNGGMYSIYIPEDIDDEIAFDMMSDAESFRTFVLEYGKVEVI